MLARERVRFAGEPVAVVAAETAEVARQARDLVEVEYEPCEGVFDPRAALEPDAPRVHQDSSNLLAEWQDINTSLTKIFGRRSAA